jgi:hypothetical protein
MASPSVLIDVWAELTYVQAALDQMIGSDRIQSCSGKLKADVTSQVTVEWHEPQEGQPIWVLSCD